MEFKLCLCTLSLLLVTKCQKVLVVSPHTFPKADTLPALARDALTSEDELFYLTLNHPDSHAKEHGCKAAYQGVRTAHPDTDRRWEENQYSFSDLILTNSTFNPFDLIIMDDKTLPSKSRLSCWLTTPILFYIQDKILSLPADFNPRSINTPYSLSELPSKNFTERLKTIKHLLKYLISLYKEEGVAQTRALVSVLVHRGRLDALQYSTHSHSYIERYNVDVWCCIFTVVAVLAGTAIYLVTIIILHILEKSRQGARIM